MNKLNESGKVRLGAEGSIGTVPIGAKYEFLGGYL